MSVRRLLGVLVLVLLPLAGCGEKDSGDARGSGPSAPSTSSEPSADPGSEPTAEVVEILSQTAAGGEVGVRPVRLDRSRGVAELTRGLRGDRIRRDLESIVTGIRLREGQSLWGQVISIGCDVPPSARVRVADGRVTIAPAKVIAPKHECLAPVTSVAVVVITQTA